MTAKDKLLQLSSLTGIHKTREHFSNISGKAVYIRDDFKANLNELTINANLLVDNILNGNINITDISLKMDNNTISANIDEINFKGELYEY